VPPPRLRPSDDGHGTTFAQGSRHDRSRDSPRRSSHLQLARERAAASLEDAAQKCGHGPEEVAGWERGASDPPLSALRDLAAAYGVPLSVFLLSTPPQTPLPPVDRRVRSGVMEPPTTMDLARALHRAAALQVVARDVMSQLDGVPVEQERIGAWTRGTRGC